MNTLSEFKLQVAGFLLACIGVGWYLSQKQNTVVAELNVGRIESGSAMSQVLATDFAESERVVGRSLAISGQQLLWLGNSQLPTINDQKDGDRAAVEILHDRLKARSWTVSGLAPPNANLQEHLLLFAYAAVRLKPKVLLLPICFDDLRESGVRPQLADAIRYRQVSDWLSESEIGRLLIAEAQAQASEATADAKNTADTVEDFLNSSLEVLPVWKQRGSIRSWVFVDLHYLRNTLFGIKPQSIRKMIPARMDRNLKALDQILRSAREIDCKVLLYIPPLRTDVPIPYEPDSYFAFKKQVELLAQESGIAFSNFQDIVVAEEWGTKQGTTLAGGEELDFMHFTKQGHEALESAIAERLADLGWLD